MWRALRGADVIKPSMIKEFPGQELLLLFLYLSFIIFCVFLYESTWCLLYQEETEAYIVRQSYIDIDFKNFKNLSLDTLTAKQNIKFILIIAGTIAILGAVAAFTVIQKSVKIAWAHTTLNTTLQVQSIAMILVAAVLMDAGRGVAPLFDLVTLVQYNQPNYIPELYTSLGAIVIFLAVVVFAAASFESRMMLTFYWVISILLMLFLVALSVQINISSYIL